MDHQELPTCAILGAITGYEHMKARIKSRSDRGLPNPGTGSGDEGVAECKS